MFDLSILKGISPSTWKKTAVVPVYKKGNSSNYRPVSTFKDFYKVFENVIHNQVSFIFEYELHLSQNRFVK
jgi:hypothetical protein